MPRTNRPFLLLLIVWLSGTASLAAEVVVLTNGQDLDVRKVIWDEGYARLELKQGGQIVLAIEEIDSILSVPETTVTPVPREDPACRPLPPNSPFRAEIVAAANEFGLDPFLVHAVIAVESAFNPRAISSRGAVGLMQLLPETADRYQVTDLFDPAENLRAGSAHLRFLLNRYAGHMEFALAAYNAGEGRVDRSKGIPAIRETREYVTRVMRRYRERG